MRRPTESAFTDEMRMYTDDLNGNRVLVGLTLEETDEIESLTERKKREWSGEWPYSSLKERSTCGQRYLELHDKHEMARLQVISAEAEARQSTIN